MRDKIKEQAHRTLMDLSSLHVQTTAVGLGMIVKLDYVTTDTCIMVHNLIALNKRACSDSRSLINATRTVRNLENGNGCHP